MLQKTLFLFSVLYFLGCSSNEIDSDSVTDKQSNELYIKFDDTKKWKPDWSDKNILVHHWLSDPTYLHPANVTAQNAVIIMGLTQCVLVAVDQVNRVIKPMLVKALPQVSGDNLKFTYELLAEATWDDGTPITSEDIIFTFKANKSPFTDNPSKKTALHNIRTITSDSLNAKRFTVIMRRPYIQSVAMLADFPILSRKFFDPQNILIQYSVENVDDPGMSSNKSEDLKNWSAGYNDGKYGNDLSFFYGAGPIR